jgi:zinc protease
MNINFKNITLSSFITLGATLFSNAQNFDRSVRPLAGQTKTLQLPDAQTFTLPNGLQVFVVENHKLPKLSFSLDVDVDPALQGNAAGYLDMIGELMMGGTQTMSKDEFNAKLDALGGTLAPSASGVYASCLIQHKDAMLQLFSDMITKPKFSQAELDKLKSQTLSGLATQLDDPEAMASNLISALLFGKQHPYGEIVKESTVKNITLTQCNNYFKTYFKPNTSYLAIVGDITLAEAKLLASKYFGSWQKGIVPKAKYAVPVNNTNTKVSLVNKTGAVQSVVRVSYPVDLKPGSKQGIPLRVAENILGGGSSGRLFQNLRETHSWTYGAYASISNDKLPNSGRFEAETNCKTEATDSSVAAILNEMKRMSTELVDEATLNAVKNKLAGNYAMSLEEPRNIANNAINIVKYKMDKNYYNTYLQELANVNAQDVLAISKQYIDVKKANVIVAGDKLEIADKLKPFAASGKVDFYDLYGNKLVETKPVVTNSKMQPKDIIVKFINAVGGEQNWKNVNDITKKMIVVIGKDTLDLEEYKKAPNKYYQVLSAEGSVFQKKVFDGTNGVESTMQGETPFDESAIEEMNEEAKFVGEIKYLEPGYKLEQKGTEKINGKDAYILKVTSPTGKIKMQYYDLQTGFKVKEVQTISMGNNTATLQFTMFDYKEVKGGLKYPFTTIQKTPGGEFKIYVKSIDINTGIDDSKFKLKK